MAYLDSLGKAFKEKGLSTSSVVKLGSAAEPDPGICRGECSRHNSHVNPWPLGHRSVGLGQRYGQGVARRGYASTDRTGQPKYEGVLQE